MMCMYSAGRLMGRNIIRTWMMCIVCPTQAFLFWDFKKRLQWLPLHKDKFSPESDGRQSCRLGGMWLLWSLQRVLGFLQGLCRDRQITDRILNAVTVQRMVGLWVCPKSQKGPFSLPNRYFGFFFVLDFLRSVIFWLFFAKSTKLDW